MNTTDSLHNKSLKHATLLFIRANILLLGFSITFLIICIAHTNLVRTVFKGNAHDVRQILAIAGIVLSVSYILGENVGVKFSLRPLINNIPWKTGIVQVWFFIAFCTSLVGVMNYYSFNMDQFTGGGDHYDLTYYYINSKYFKELGYSNFYDALLIADRESYNRLNRIKTFRELNTYTVVSVEKAFARTNEVRSYFSTERWAAFKEDVGYFTRQPISGGWQYFFNDHGYNPPPTWTLIGGSLSSIVPVSHVKWITSIDIVLLILMFAAVFAVFGPGAGFISILFFTSTLSGLWPKAGHALLRFDWLTAVVIGYAAYHAKKHMLAGGLLMFSALMRVFPAVFFFPFFIEGAWTLLTKRKIKNSTFQLFKGAVLVSAILFTGVLFRLGPSAIYEGRDKILMHAGPDSYSSQRVGLGDAMVFRGEKTRTEMNMNGGTLGKAEQIRSYSFYLKMMAFLTVAILSLLIIKGMAPAYQYLPFCVLFVFILTTPQINYFNMRILLIIWHLWERSKVRSIGGISILFAAEIAANYLDVPYERYTATSMTSVFLTFYYVFVMGTFNYELLWKLPEYTGAWNLLKKYRLLWIGIITLWILSPVIYLMKKELDERKPAEISLEQLAVPKKRGSSWNQSGNIIMKRGGVHVTFKKTYNDTIEFSADNNDTHILKFYSDLKKIDQITVPPGSVSSGLDVFVVSVPDKVVKKGYDAITLFPAAGDGYYSIGHLILK